MGSKLPQLPPSDGQARPSAPPPRVRAVHVKAEHVAWCRYTASTIVTCDSNDRGAFRVYRAPRWTPCTLRLPNNYESVIGWGRLAGDLHNDCHEVYLVDRVWHSVRAVAVDVISHWMPFPCGPSAG